MPRSLILEPTRELAAQVADQFDIYGKYQNLSKALLIGGVSFDEQVRLLERGVDVLIATPGRLLDHFERGRVLLSDVKLLVIDEADRMLDMGFIPDVERIVSLMPRIRQTLMFSATMPTEIRCLADQFLMNPKEISVDPPASAAETVNQSLVVVGQKEKRDALRKLIRHEEVRNALIFCNRKRDVGVLHRSLQRHGFEAGALHGDMDQYQRMATLDAFKNDEIKLLVCSDVAARGLDIQAMSHVFNFDVPSHAEDYIHRIGRTGRAGLEGRAITLATPEDTRYLAAITGLIGGEIPRLALAEIEEAVLEPDSERRGRSRRGRQSKKEQDEKKPRGRPEAKKRDNGSQKDSVNEKDKPRREATSHAKEKGNGSRNRSNKRKETEDTPVGLGDHVPAFLLRPTK